VVRLKRGQEGFIGQEVPRWDEVGGGLFVKKNVRRKYSGGCGSESGRCRVRWNVAFLVNRYDGGGTGAHVGGEEGRWAGE